MEKLERLAKALNEVKTIMTEIDPKAFATIDLTRHDGVPQVMIHGKTYDPILKFEKKGAVYVNNVPDNYEDYGVTVDGVHIIKSIHKGAANNASMAV